MNNQSINLDRTVKTTAVVAKTMLSVNLNKIALLRNSRGRDFPSVVGFAQQSIELGVKGITIHPRPDERHIRRQDARDLALLLQSHPGVELNIEGYPSSDFIALIKETKPHQVTLVPDGENQLTSDHGWNLRDDFELLQVACDALRSHAGRIAVFVDPDADVSRLPGVCNRIELYTEAYAKACNDEDDNQVKAILEVYGNTVAQARACGLAVNAGHDLDLDNLARFLKIPDIFEVSIGHALTVEALQFGWQQVIGRYLAICRGEG